MGERRRGPPAGPGRGAAGVVTARRAPGARPRRCHGGGAGVASPARPPGSAGVERARRAPLPQSPALGARPAGRGSPCASPRVRDSCWRSVIYGENSTTSPTSGNSCSPARRVPAEAGCARSVRCSARSPCFSPVSVSRTALPKPSVLMPELLDFYGHFLWSCFNDGLYCSLPYGRRAGVVL